MKSSLRDKTEFGMLSLDIHRICKGLFGDNSGIIFSIKTCLIKALLMCTHNICFYGEIRKTLKNHHQQAPDVTNFKTFIFQLDLSGMFMNDNWRYLLLLIIKQDIKTW